MEKLGERRVPFFVVNLSKKQSWADTGSAANPSKVSIELQFSLNVFHPFFSLSLFAEYKDCNNEPRGEGRKGESVILLDRRGNFLDRGGNFLDRGERCIRKRHRLECVKKHVSKSLMCLECASVLARIVLDKYEPFLADDRFETVSIFHSSRVQEGL